MRYGYIGLGHLGGHLAASLLRAGFQLTVHDRNRAAADPLIAKGAAWADSPKALGRALRCRHHLPAVAGGRAKRC